MLKPSLRAVACSFVFCVLALVAQDFRATITGHVYDPTNAPVANTSVRVQNLDTNEISLGRTDSAGLYSVPFLKPGRYRLSVETPGFKKLIRDNVVLSIGQTAGLDLQLEVGQLTESVTVSADTAVLDTEDSNRGLVIDQKRVTELPLNARNPFMLANLSAGVNFNGNAIYQRPFDNGAIADWSVNGGLNRKNEFLLDGAPNNAQAGGNNLAYVPPVDSVSEFKIQTNTYDAQYGKSAGGVLNVLTKSGANDLHGTGYEFARRNALDANSFQNNSQGLPRSGHSLDQYGGSIGGPLFVPKLYDGRNKSFFFFNYEGYQEETPTPLSLSVPQPEFLQGDFSRLADRNGNKITIYDPATGRADPSGGWVRQPFQNNQIPANRLNPTAQRILGYFAAPNTTTPGSAYSQNNLFVPGGENLSSDEFYNMVIRLDQNFGDKHHVFFRLGTNDRTETRGTNGIFGKPGETSQNPLKRINDAYTLDWVGSLSPTLLVNTRFSIARYIEGSAGLGNVDFDPATLGFPQSLVNQLADPNSFGRYEFNGYTALGRYSNFNYTNTVALQTNLTKIWGKHAVRAGVDLRWIQYNIQNQGNPFRLVSNEGFTQENFANGDSLSGNSLASFLLGAPASGGADINAFTSNLYRYFAPYIQDDWKITRRLSVNLGLRWDFNVPPKERYDRLNRGFDPNVISPANDAVNRAAFPNLPLLRGGLLFVKPDKTSSNLDLTAVQPRIGIAFQAKQNLVLRGGFGRFYLNPDNEYLQNAGFEYTNPLVSSLDNGRTALPGLLNNPFPNGLIRPPGRSLGAATLLGQGPGFFDPTFKLPYSDSFSFGLQYKLPLSSRLAVTYVGNRGYKLQTLNPYNEPSLGIRQQCNIYEGGNPQYCDQLLDNPFYNSPLFAGTSLGNSPQVSRFNLNRPRPQFGGITQRGRNDGHLWYNGLQIDYGIRGKHGLSMTFAYTFSKAVEQGGLILNSNDENPPAAFNDVLKFIPERSLTAYDRTHVFKVSTVYELPIGRGKPFLNFQNGFLSRLVSGWQHTMLFQYSSGRPWDLPGNVRYLREASGNLDWDAAVVQGVRPCVSRVQDSGVTVLQTFSSQVDGCTLANANFEIQPRYAPRTTPLRDGRLRLDAKPQFDMSLAKNTAITERIRVQFRAEAFNVFNTYWMPLQQFNNDGNSAQFGQIIKGTVGYGNANFPRQIQLGLKLVF